MGFDDDMRAEGEPEQEFNPGIASRLPRKRVAGGLLFHDDAGRILMVEPVYKPTWDIPGGLAEDDESPLAACRREVREEMRLDIEPGRLLVVDWIPRHGVWRDGVMFIFDGGTLTAGQLDAVSLQADELSSYKFVTLDEAADHVRPSLERRLRAAVAALDSTVPAYLEFGRDVSES
ncbi:NUDIX hydrolase [Catenulispora subtropica]|uniref:NUDIX hydrolase n=1 Tax=Catenulispora subtropica TaxID=450798 RepID=UPI0031D77DB2